MPNKKLSSKLSDAIPNPGPGMFITKEDEVGIARANEVICKFLKTIDGQQFSELPEKSREDLLPSVIKIVRQYFADKQYDGRFTFSELKNPARKLRSSLSRLRKTIESLPKPLIVALNRQMGNSDETSFTKDRVAELTSAADMLHQACAPIAERTNMKGGPLSVEKACGSLWILRETITCKPFVRQWNTAKTPERLAIERGDQEFVGPDALFVQVVLRALDPEITVAHIRTALKRVAAAKSGQDRAEKFSQS